MQCTSSIFIFAGWKEQFHEFHLLHNTCIVGGKDHESAESYFKNIEEQTGTLILWPSKLKIGAKSKKGNS